MIEKSWCNQKNDLKKFGTIFVEISYFKTPSNFWQVFKFCNEKLKKKKVLPGLYQFFCNESKNLIVTFWALTMRLHKVYIFLAQAYPWTITWQRLLSILQMCKLVVFISFSGQSSN